EAPLPDVSAVHRLFEAQAAATPDAVAVVHEDRALTYRALDAAANRLARHLRDLGVGPDVLVGLFLERSCELVAALLAVSKAGCAYSPIDPRPPAQSLASMLEDSRCAILVTERRRAGALTPGCAKRIVLEDEAAALARLPATRLEHEPRRDHLVY